MKKKNKGRLSKILCTLLVCIFGVLGVGCSGNDSGYSSSLKDRYENGEISFEEYLEQRLLSQSVPLYGTKVLYRPESYGWEDEDYIGQGNEYYYGQYAWWILDSLVSTYAFAQSVKTTEEPIIETIVPDLTDSDKLNGFYDSIRYQISSYGNNISQEVKLTKNADGSFSQGSPSQISNSYVVRASTQKSWNWSFDTNINNYEYSYYAYDTEGKPAETPSTENISVIAPAFDSTLIFTNRNEVINEMQRTYSREPYQNDYSKIFLGTEYEEKQLQFLNYSEYVKALEYAIYCFNLDLTPNSMEVRLKSDGTPLVEIAGYPATDEKSSVDIALETIQDVFKKVGSYVGITERQQIRLKNWILQNIIGENSDNSFTINEITTTSTQYYYEETNGSTTTKVFCDENGNDQTTPQPKVETSNPVKVTDIDRHYEENVDAIIDICTTLVSIGQKPDDEGEENNAPTISDKYLASEVIDYFGNDFFISADKGNEFANIPELEYQSFALMFRKKFQFSNIRLMFNYKGSDDIVGNESITINIHMNHYTKEDNHYRPAYLKQGTNKYEVMQITIQDTGFSYGSRNNTAMLYGINSDDINGKARGITCSEFTTDIGNGILQSIEEYNGLVSIGTALPLTGNNDRRNYYIMQNDFNEEDKTTYTYGTLNPEKFSGSDGCDFFEVAFEVVKVTTASDYATKNYKFQVGLAVVA